MRQQTLIAAADFTVALAGRFFETRPVRNDNAAPPLVDQTCPLERAQHNADARALRAEHLGQELVRKRQRVLLDPVMGAQSQRQQRASTL